MAHAVGVTPEQLTGARRDDAAEILAEIMRQQQDEDNRVPKPAMSPRLAAAVAPLDDEDQEILADFAAVLKTHRADRDNRQDA
jgi:hypothetical protein